MAEARTVSTEGQRGPHRARTRVVRSWRSLIVAAATGALLAGPLVGTASADSKPSDPKTPVTVSADALAAPQIDGVVWDQLVVGNTVFVGGRFSTARPAGAAAGRNTVPRSNLLAYDLTTGVLLPFAPALNAQVKTLAISPDKKTLYVGGAFTKVTMPGKSAANRYRIAAFTVATGALVAGFAPTINAEVAALAVTGTSVYAAGTFSSTQKTPRAGLAAFTPSNAKLQKWAPIPAGGRPTSLVVSPSADKVVVGGSFTTLNGSSRPGFGLGAVTADTGSTLPWRVNEEIRNGGSGAGVTSLSSDATGVHVTAFSYRAEEQLPYTEGVYAARWSDGELLWHEDCHGDSYSVASAGDVVYTAGHAHDCERVGGFGSFVTSVSATAGYHRALAFSNEATGTLAPFDGELYTDFGGQPAPSLLDWYPYFSPGSATGQTQGPWDVTVAGDYVLYGGEFTRVNGTAQQGLVRFRIPSQAPNDRGPELSGAAMAPTISQRGAGEVELSWPANYDPDNRDLRYEVHRDGATTPVATVEEQSRFWDRPVISVVDSGLTAGRTYSYRITTTDPFGNATTGSAVTVTPTASDPTTDYDRLVLEAEPLSYWPLDETTGSRAVDRAGGDDLTLSSSVERGREGIDHDEGGFSSSFSGTGPGGAGRERYRAPESATVELWFSSTGSGRLLDIADKPASAATAYDLSLELRDDGRLSFAMTTNTAIVTDESYDDGGWHHAVATLGSTGATIWVDGTLMASNAETTSTRPMITGTWRLAIGFTGTIDNVAVYDRVLTSSEISAHSRVEGG